MIIPPASQWQVLVARGKYPLLFIWELSQGVLFTHQAINTQTKLTSYLRVGGISYLRQTEAKTLTQELNLILQHQPLKTLAWLTEFYRLTTELLTWLKKINRRLDTTQNYSKTQLKTLYFNYESRIQKIWSWGYYNFLFDKVLAEELIRHLKLVGYKTSQIPAKLKILANHKYFTPHIQAEIALLKLASRLEQQKKPDEAVLQNYLRTWGWINSWVYDYKPLELSEVLVRLKNLKAKTPLNFIIDLKRKKRQEISVRQKFLSRYSDTRLHQLANILSEYSFWHTYKIEKMTEAAYLARPLFSRLAKKFKISFSQFLALTPEEVRREKIEPDRLSQRAKNVGLIMLNGKKQILEGKQLQKVQRVMKLEKAGKKSSIINLKGQVVFSGKAGVIQGKVKIISRHASLSNLSAVSDRIIVTEMSSSAMVPLLKASRALITDEGGLLSHAAIISRELGIPCIIGTKVATQILKDGDLVEVDANNGIIKKIK